MRQDHCIRWPFCELVLHSLSCSTYSPATKCSRIIAFGSRSSAWYIVCCLVALIARQLNAAGSLHSVAVLQKFTPFACLVGGCVCPSLSCDSPARSVQATIFATLPDSALQSLPCYSPGNLMQQDACSPGNLMQQDSSYEKNRHPSFAVLLHLLVSIQFMHSVVPWFSQATLFTLLLRFGTTVAVL